MPTLIDGYTIAHVDGLDRRIKLTERQKEDIRAIHDDPTQPISQRQLAKRYGVSRRTIQFVLNPDDYEKQKARARERRRDGRYYDREKCSQSVQKTRQYKRDLLASGKIDDSYAKRETP